MKTSSTEIRDLIAAGVLTTVAFAIVIAGGFNGLNYLGQNFLTILGIAFFTAGIAFIFHEIAHKIVAQNYGLYAEFRASYRMLIVTLFLSLAGFIFAAPGAVMINGAITRDRHGKIALAGPVTNIVLSVIFLVASLILSGTILGRIASYGFAINAAIALFNLIPAAPFDGEKIRSWNNTIFITVVVISGALFLLSWFI